MTGTATGHDNSESGGSRQVSPQQQLYSSHTSDNEATTSHEPPLPATALSDSGKAKSIVAPSSSGSGNMFSVTSNDSLRVVSPKLSVQSNRSRPFLQFQRSRSASEIARLDAAAAVAKELSSPITNEGNDNWPPSSVGISRTSVKPFNSLGVAPEIQFPPGVSTRASIEDSPMEYSKSIPTSSQKRSPSRRATTMNDYPGGTISALAISIHKGKQSSKLRRRLIFKNGDSNISATNVHKMSQRYLADIFTTLVDMQWRWTILLFSSSFFVSWVFFAAIWWLVAYLHDDLTEGPPHGNLNGTKPCVQYVNSFPTALLFSIETQHTIGYGFRHTTDECPHAIGLMMVQSVFSVLLQAFMAGIVFAKLSRPLKRAETLMFSKHAVICERDGRLCLLIRIGDMRKSHILDGTIRALMVKKRETREGETLPLYQHNVELRMECGDQQLYLFWPLIACHVIDENSPLYNISFKSLRDERFELIVILEGVVESTGMSTQAKTSYLPAEIKWGHRFTPLITYQKEDGTYQIDYRLFDETYDVETPMCSARELTDRRAEGRPIPMIKPVGFQGEYNTPAAFFSAEQTQPPPYINGANGDTFKPSAFFHGGNGNGDTNNNHEIWPAAPRASVIPQLQRNASWFNWLRKRKNQTEANGADVVDHDRRRDMLSVAAPRTSDIERGETAENRKLLSTDERLAHDV